MFYDDLKNAGFSLHNLVHDEDVLFYMSAARTLVKLHTEHYKGLSADHAFNVYKSVVKDAIEKNMIHFLIPKYLADKSYGPELHQIDRFFHAIRDVFPEHAQLIDAHLDSFKRLLENPNDYASIPYSHYYFSKINGADKKIDDLEFTAKLLSIPQTMHHLYNVLNMHISIEPSMFSDSYEPTFLTQTGERIKEGRDPEFDSHVLGLLFLANHKIEKFFNNENQFSDVAKLIWQTFSRTKNINTAINNKNFVSFQNWNEKLKLAHHLRAWCPVSIIGRFLKYSDLNPLPLTQEQLGTLKQINPNYHFDNIDNNSSTYIVNIFDREKNKILNIVKSFDNKKFPDNGTCYELLHLPREEVEQVINPVFLTGVLDSSSSSSYLEDMHHSWVLNPPESFLNTQFFQDLRKHEKFGCCLSRCLSAVKSLFINSGIAGEDLEDVQGCSWAYSHNNTLISVRSVMGDMVDSNPSSCLVIPNTLYIKNQQSLFFSPFLDTRTWSHIQMHYVPHDAVQTNFEKFKTTLAIQLDEKNVKNYKDQIVIKSVFFAITNNNLLQEFFKPVVQAIRASGATGELLPDYYSHRSLKNKEDYEFALKNSDIVPAKMLKVIPPDMPITKDLVTTLKKLSTRKMNLLADNPSLVESDVLKALPVQTKKDILRCNVIDANVVKELNLLPVLASIKTSAAAKKTLQYLDEEELQPYGLEYLSKVTSFRVGTEKLRQLRDFVESQGNSVTPKQAIAAGFDTSLFPKKQINFQSSNKRLTPEQIDELDKMKAFSAEDVQAKINAIPQHRTIISFSKWTGVQRHNNQSSFVTQINIDPTKEQKIKDAGLQDLWTRFTDAVSHAHPVIPNKTLGWIRWTGNTNGVHIDEIQSDIGQNFGRQIAATAAPNQQEEARRRAEEKFPPEQMQKLYDIVFDGKSHQEFLHSAFMESLRKQKKPNQKMKDFVPKETKVHMWSIIPRAKLSGMDTDKKLPLHMQETYVNLPPKEGYTEGEYGELPTQNNEKRAKQKTWKTILRKSFRKNKITLAKGVRHEALKKDLQQYRATGEMGTAYVPQKDEPSFLAANMIYSHNKMQLHPYTPSHPHMKVASSAQGGRDINHDAIHWHQQAQLSPKANIHHGKIMLIGQNGKPQTFDVHAYSRNDHVHNHEFTLHPAKREWMHSAIAGEMASRSLVPQAHLLHDGITHYLLTQHPKEIGPVSESMPLLAQQGDIAEHWVLDHITGTPPRKPEEFFVGSTQYNQGALQMHSRHNSFAFTYSVQNPMRPEGWEAISNLPVPQHLLKKWATIDGDQMVNTIPESEHYRRPNVFSHATLKDRMKERVQQLKSFADNALRPNQPLVTYGDLANALENFRLHESVKQKKNLEVLPPTIHEPSPSHVEAAIHPADLPKATKDIAEAMGGSALMGQQPKAMIGGAHGTASLEAAATQGDVAIHMGIDALMGRPLRAPSNFYFSQTGSMHGKQTPVLPSGSWQSIAHMPVPQSVLQHWLVADEEKILSHFDNSFDKSRIQKRLIALKFIANSGLGKQKLLYGDLIRQLSKIGVQ